MLLSISLFTSILFAQDKILEIWPDGAPSDNGLSGSEVDEGNNRVSNISVAKMYIYTPEKELNTGVAVILLPGGGYRREAMSHEGYEVGEWLKSKGITGIVLKYRLPNKHHQIPLEDANRAIRFTRYHAKEWGIDPDKIGIGGASAGGHLASTAGTNFGPGNPNSEDPIEALSSRPDFMLLLYPMIYIKKDSVPQFMIDRFFGDDSDWETVKQYSSDLNVTADTPPAFFILADNDRAAGLMIPKHSIELYLAMKKFNIPAEMHIFGDGGHGFGITKQGLPVDQWPDLFYNWLKAIKMLE